MKKYLCLAIAALLPAISFADISGTFTCKHILKTIAKANGQSKQTTIRKTDSITFYPDGSFILNDPSNPNPTHGRWSVSGKKLTIEFFQGDIVRNALYGCSLSGADCKFLGYTFKSNLKVKKNQSRIKGTNKSSLTLMVNGIIANGIGNDKMTCYK